MDPFRWAMFLLTVLTVSRIHQHYPLLARFRPMIVLVIICFFYALANPKSLAAGKVLQRWPSKLIAGLAIVACLSVPFGISMGAAARFILDNYSRTIVYSVLLVLAIRGARDLYAMIWAYVLAAGILSYFSLFVFGLKKAYGSEVARLSDLYTYDANDIGVVVLVALPLAMLLVQVATPMSFASYVYRSDRRATSLP
jgi:hypothetical protein